MAHSLVEHSSSADRDSNHTESVDYKTDLRRSSCCQHDVIAVVLDHTCSYRSSASHTAHNLAR